MTKNVKNYSLTLGNPARQVGWVCICGDVLARGTEQSEGTQMKCSACNRDYKLLNNELVSSNE